VSERLVCGVDEAGRGPLAGPVLAAAVILDPARPIDGLADSKKLGPERREALFEQIRRQALGWAIGRAEVDEIDRINILQASMLAMQRAVAGLRPEPACALVDGNRAPVLACTTRTVVGGDGCEACIGAASIVAKVLRDREMVALDRLYPGYGLACHKGYPTRAHVDALRRLGASPVHRRSFAPVARYLD
jgi:ribonuclease HII